MAPQIIAEADQIDELFNCLGHARRRHLITVVAAESRSISVDSVIDEIAAIESNADIQSSSDDSVDSIAVSVVHCHLPKLQNAGIVAVDGETSTVTAGDQFDDAVEALLAV